MRNLLVAVVLFCAVANASAAISLSPNLVGIWARPDSEFKGDALIKGSAMYLDSDGIGAAIAGNGNDVLGARMVVTSFNPEANELHFDLTEGGKVIISGTLIYDPIKKLLVSTKNANEIYERRFDSVSDNVRESLGVEKKGMPSLPSEDQSISAIPDQIQENFGARPSPYPGFLALPPEAVLSDFKEVKHHYTKREYTLDFTRMVDGKKIDLNIVESDYTKFFYSELKLVREFNYQGITGQVYVYYNQKTQETSFNLIWLNPPKQRIAIYLTQTPAKEYAPEDLIKILESMKNVR